MSNDGFATQVHWPNIGRLLMTEMSQVYKCSDGPSSSLQTNAIIFLLYALFEATFLNIM
jgi:hypothetical protein